MIYARTTPTHSFIINLDTAFIETIEIVYKQGNEIVLTKNNFSDFVLEPNKISWKLTEDDTRVFNDKRPVKIQMYVTTTAGDALTTKVCEVQVGEVLDRGL